MEVKISESLVNAIGKSNLTKFGFTMDNLNWQKFVEINLVAMTNKQVTQLRELIEPHLDIYGAKVLLKDIDTWLSATDDAGKVKIRKLEFFEDMLIEYIAHLDGQRLYQKHDLDGNAWLCYYVDEIEYHSEQTGNYGKTPAYVEMSVIYDKFGERKCESYEFHSSDVRGKTVIAVLAKEGFYAETPEMRENYKKEIEKYGSIIPQIGKQYNVVGIGTDETPDEKDDDRWHSSYGIHTFNFTDHEKRNRVVIDIFLEGEKKHSSRDVSPNLYFWKEKKEDINRRIKKEKLESQKEGKIDTRRELPIEDSVDEETPNVEIPTHPFLVVFDLQRHLRLSVHVNYLTEYVYDEHLSDKLILPAEIKTLISMLIEQKEGNFKDIVAGKGGGAIVLLTGPAGVGKTLTAEVFAEAEKKPLYSVQASQLGTDPDELEKALLKVLTRASRWNAIMLLDECDVYVHERGNSLDQNAIVGVFLRVLEYHASVLFLTTNRPDLVDDAIASRCVARIDYKYPVEDDLKKIWRVLADSSEIKLNETIINEFVSKHPKMSGRDVKNLLKLAQLISINKKEPINVDSLEYVIQFKPTVLKET